MKRFSQALKAGKKFTRAKLLDGAGVAILVLMVRDRIDGESRLKLCV